MRPYGEMDKRAAIQFNVPADMRSAINQLAADHGGSISATVRDLVRAGLTQHGYPASAQPEVLPVRSESTSSS